MKDEPRVVAVSEDEGVVLWRQRGVSLSGEQFEGEVLGLYRVREGRLARAQMFYFRYRGGGALLGEVNGATRRRFVRIIAGCLR